MNETDGNSGLSSGFLSRGSTPNACCKKFAAGLGGCAIAAAAISNKIEKGQRRILAKLPRSAEYRCGCGTVSGMQPRRAIRAILLLLYCAAIASAASDAGLERRKQYLETLQKILPHTTSTELTGRISAFDKSWEDAIRRTGELPPDFSAMPSIAGLPDPLLLREGAQTAPITTMEQWRRQRQ